MPLPLGKHGEKARSGKSACYWMSFSHQANQDGQCRSSTYILETGIEAYAHAAAGPEYEYPACLSSQFQPLI